MANPIAVPGTNVPSGAAVSPGGAQGPTAISANANNKATLGSDSLTLVQGTAAGVAATTHAQTVSGDDPQLTNARTPTAHGTTHLDNGTGVIPVATTLRTGLAPIRSGTATTYLNGAGAYATPSGIAPSAHASTHITGGSDVIALAAGANAGLLRAPSAATTDFLDGTHAWQNLTTAIQPVIWSQRLQSVNSVGNCNFEVDQRFCGASMVVAPASGNWGIDRWNHYMSSGTGRLTAQQIPTNVTVPGTNFLITSKIFRFTVTTAQGSLGVNDVMQLWQYLEGTVTRQLYNDVSSISILARSSVVNLKFGCLLVDNAFSKTLAKLCTLSTANTWTLITLPNLPSMASSGGTFPLTSGQNGYNLVISLASGTSQLVPVDTWQTTTISGGAVGQSNFLATASATFDLAFVQHQPGPICSTLIDKPFTDNLNESLRYFCKSWNYGTAVGTANFVGDVETTALASQNIFTHVPFKQIMAKTPTVILYSAGAAAANNVYDVLGALNRATTGARDIGETGFAGASLSTPNASATIYAFHYAADTGW